MSDEIKDLSSSIIVLNNISKFPKHLKDLIYVYIPYTELICLNKNYFIKYHFNHRYNFYLFYATSIKKTNYIEGYIKHVIKNDLIYILDLILLRLKNRWLKKTRYHYKGNLYPCYLSYLQSLCIAYNSNNCLIKIKEILKCKKNKKGKKSYRNVISYNNTWKN